jgi:hypothetical protein
MPRVQGAPSLHPSNFEDHPISAARSTYRGDEVVVHDDWPAIPPVTETELRIVEAYFVEIFDALFAELH